MLQGKHASFVKKISETFNFLRKYVKFFGDVELSGRFSNAGVISESKSWRIGPGRQSCRSGGKKKSLQK